jgi:hypothetical protein
MDIALLVTSACTPTQKRGGLSALTISGDFASSVRSFSLAYKLAADVLKVPHVLVNTFDGSLVSCTCRDTVLEVPIVLRASK